MKKVFVIVLSLTVVLFSCTKNSISIKSDDLVGTWMLKQYSGGIAGGIFIPNDNIVISFTSSEYTSIRNDTVISKGSYTLTKAGEPNYYYSDEIINLSSPGGDKITYGIVLKNDSLSLDEGCCDEFSYLYIRKK